MTNRELLLNPLLEFDYVSDSVLWDDVFHKPLPVDLRDSKKGYVELPEYFEVGICFVDSQKGYKVERKALTPKDNFFDTSREVRGRAFVCMLNFLNRFNRPFRDCVLYVPHHPDVEPEEKYSPINLYSKIPMLPTLSDKGNTLRVFLTPQIYNELTWYCFKKKTYQGTRAFLDFSFECFGGFILHY